MKSNREIKAYLVGGGIASLASAVYLIRDGDLAGKNIYIFEEGEKTGGALDANQLAPKTYLMRGGRMFEEKYVCTFDLLSEIPSLTETGQSVKESIFNLNRKHPTLCRSRLIFDGKKVNLSSFGFSRQDRLAIVRLLFKSEKSLGTSTIANHFDASFFKTNFWFLFCSTFAFLPWHSAIEFRRYLLRFFHHFKGTGLRTLSEVWRTEYNQYDSIVLPIVSWLKEQGVNFETATQVKDFEFQINKNSRVIKKIFSVKNKTERELILADHDLVIATIGSMTANSSLGKMDKAPQLKIKNKDNSWLLWENIAKKYPDLGRPEVFTRNIDQTKFISFTVTATDPLFFRLIEELTGNKANTDNFITITDSNWLLSIVLPRQPHFINQPKDIGVFWGYALFPDQLGNFVKKKMSDCTGKEILTEIIHHLKFEKDREQLFKTTICIPCLMPFITSQFAVRRHGDRPLVIPRGAKNFALIGQFSELPHDTVFTVEYSIRTAQEAVFSLLRLNKKTSQIHKGYHHPKILWQNFWTLFE
ncbi:MAG: oleate hydratase [Candidatus Vogelbacteria bacterium]|nr:oleate hydratase [Candidatus Vogelbacteria bacterium]